MSSKQTSYNPTGHAVSPRRYSDSPRSLFSDASFSALRMQFLRRRKCDMRCRCRCHLQTRAQSPQMLQSVLGRIFVGYASLPLLTPSCDNRRCQGSSEGFLQVNYYFPRWFLARILSLVVKFQDAQTPEVSLRILNMRSSCESIFRYAEYGDADSIQFLLAKGRGSVLDVTDDSGHSPLHVRVCNTSSILRLIWIQLAVAKSHVEVIDILLKMGSEPYLENRTQEQAPEIITDVHTTC